MSLPVPLNIRLVNANADRYITSEARRYRHRSVVPGGFASASVELDRPISVNAPELAPYTAFIVYDVQTEEVVWQGRLEDPSRGVDDSGRVWKLTATGPIAHASDQVLPLIYADQGLDDFVERALGSKKAGRAESDQDANENNALRMQFDRGIVLSTNDIIGLRYLRFYEAGLDIGSINYTWDGGQSDSDYRVVLTTRSTPSGSGTNARNDALNTAGGGLSRKVVITHFPQGDDVIELRLVRANSGHTVADDVTFCLFGSFSARMLLKDQSGGDVTSYTSDGVTAKQVFADLLGRMLPRYDGANAVLASTSYVIDQLMYENGETARGVMDDIIENFEPDLFYGAWEDTPNGLSRFVLDTWPTTVTYDIDTSDGFQAPGSVVDLYDGVHVTWKAPNGRVRTTRRTQVVDMLADAGLNRSTRINLEDELASVANAVRAGDQFLAQHATPPNEGTLIVARRIFDASLGRAIGPWRIRPGHLVRVRDVVPRIDALNPTDRDGVTVFRLYAVDYDSDTNTATLELDSGARSFRRIRARQGMRRVKAPRPTWEQTHTDKQIEAHRKAEAKRKAALKKKRRSHRQTHRRH